jgi:hypothetical protein
LIVAASLLLLAVAGLGAQILAQAGADDWAGAVNVSRSGAASNAAVVVLPDGTVRVLWWDLFEGLVVAEGRVPTAPAVDPAAGEAAPPATGAAAWSEPAAAPISLRQTAMVDGQPVFVYTPIEVMPRLVGDAAGRAHAFWLGEADEETGNQPLHSSRLLPDRISWSYPLTLSVSAGALDAAADPSGGLHLAYVQPGDVGRLPAGLYYRRSSDGGATWSAPTAIEQSRYLRLLPADGDALRLTAHDADNLTAAWQDPRQGQTLVACSTDGGATWQAPRPLLASDGVPLGSRVVSVPGQPERLLWPMPGEAGSWLAVSSGGDALVLALWDGERWAVTRHLDLDARDAEMGLALRLAGLQPAFAPPDTGPEAGAGSLAVVGSDPQGDLWITGLGLEALAGRVALPAGSDAGRSGGANLSQSGAASGPAVVAGPDGRLHAFWWDRFDGLMIADGVVSTSTVTSGSEEVAVLADVWSEPRPVPLPVDATPWFLSGADGTVHALWQQAPAAGQAAAGQVAAQPLLLTASQLAADGAAWLAPQVLAESALAYDLAADISGTLHLATLVTEQTPTSPPGIYYRRAGAGGAGWTAAVPVYASRYLRLLTAPDARVRVAADATGGVYLTWDDPQAQRSLLAYSPDGGATWQAPVEVGDPQADAGSRRARLAAPADGEVLVLWEPAQGGSACELRQAPAGAVLDGSAGDGQRVLEGLASCPGDERFLPLDGDAEGQVLLMAGAGGDALTLALWDGERWSEPTRWGASFEDAETGRSVYLGNLRADLVRVAGAAGGALAGVGTDGSGDVWATSSQMGDLALVFAGPPAWSEPVAVSAGEAYPQLPAAAVDAEGRLHLLWSEGATAQEAGTALAYARWDGAQWTRPVALLASPRGRADEPALVAVGDRLHAVWSSGPSGEVLYSSAFANDAYAASGWSEPLPLPAPGEVGGEPDILAGADGTLHAVYAVPVNEGRGIYYTRSADGGQTWSPARQVFDAAAAGWLMAGEPQVAVDGQGLVHVAWLRRGRPGSAAGEGVYYARSADGGQTWSAPFEVAAGAHAGSQVAAGAAGQVHVVWNETGPQPAWWHRWSLDGGQTWTRQERVSGFDGVSAPAALLDPGGSGALYLLGASGTGGGGEGAPALLLSAWDGQRWSAPEAFALQADGVEPGVAAAVDPALGWLQALVRGRADRGEEVAQPQVWHTGRQLPEVAVAELPAGAVTALPVAATPLPAAPTAVPAVRGVTHQPAATLPPAADLSQIPPPAGENSLPIPVLLAGALAALVVGGGLATQFLRARGRHTRPDLLVRLSRAARRALGQVQGLWAALRGRLKRSRAE